MDFATHRPKPRRALAFIGISVGTLLVGVACSDSGGTTQPGSEPTPSGGGSAPAVGGATDSGKSGNAGTLNLGLPSAAAGSPGTGGGAPACATGTAAATLSDLKMFLAFDDSGSMAERDKWLLATRALGQFFSSADAAGLGVWLRLFPQGMCSMTSCRREEAPHPLTTAACAEPSVPLGALEAAPAPQDAQEAALLQALSPTTQLGGPWDGTPISAALQGAHDAATRYAASSPTGAANVVVVLVTDGEPSGCIDEVEPGITAIASSALQANGIKTYAIGLEGSQPEDIDAIARAGGVQRGVFIGSVTDTQQRLFQAFGTIKKENASCVFSVPEPPAGEELDPSLVNVSFEDGAGAPSTFGAVSEASACGGNEAWYYDTARSHIHLCPTACDKVKATPNGRVEVLFGCVVQCHPSDPRCNEPK